MTRRAWAGPAPALPVTGAGARGVGISRPMPANANAVPTRHAATDCMVLLAGRRVDDRPVIRALTSITIQRVIHTHRIQARTTAPRSSQWATSRGSKGCRDANAFRPCSYAPWPSGKPPAVHRPMGTATTIVASTTVESVDQNHRWLLAAPGRMPLLIPNPRSPHGHPPLTQIRRPAGLGSR